MALLRPTGRGLGVTVGMAGIWWQQFDDSDHILIDAILMATIRWHLARVAGHLMTAQCSWQWSLPVEARADAGRRIPGVAAAAAENGWLDCVP
jgi:hypothetical protein